MILYNLRICTEQVNFLKFFEKKNTKQKELEKTFKLIFIMKIIKIEN